MCILVGGTCSAMTYLSIVAAVFLALLILHTTKGNPEADVCKGILLLLVMQNLCIGVGAHITGNMSGNLKLLTQIPFMVVTILWVGTWKVRTVTERRNTVRMAFYILLGFIALSCVWGFGGISSSLVIVRNLTVFYMAYEVGYDNLVDEEKREEFVRTLINLGILLVVVGIPLLIKGYDWYKVIGIQEVYIAKASPCGDALPARFYTTILYKSLLRMGSLYYEPINLAYYMSIAFIASLWNNPYKGIAKILSIIVIGIGLVLTFGKGGYGMTMLLIVSAIGENVLVPFMRRVSKGLSAAILLVALGIVLTSLSIYIEITKGASIWPHIWGIVWTWEKVLKRPMGYGLGTGGNAAYALGNLAQESWFSSGGETAILSFAYQIGIFGIIAFFAVLWLMRVRHKDRKVPIFERCFEYVPIILFGMAIFQDNTFTPQCCIPFMLLQGAFKYKSDMPEDDYRTVHKECSNIERRKKI